MKEHDEKLNKLCEDKDTIASWLHMEVAKGSSADMMALKEGCDMIKDLAEAVEKCWKAKYYETVIEAMKEGEEPRYGYNHNHYASGRFAPSGRGHRMGFEPFMDEEPYVDAYMHDPRFRENMMGYQNHNTQAPNMRQNMGYHESESMNDSAMQRYREARRHYTETNKNSDKQEMDSHASEHLNNAYGTMREIWRYADPEMKKRMKSDLTALLGEMNA